MNTSTGRRRCLNIRLLALVFLMVREISILQASPERETSNEPTSAGNKIREATVEPKYVLNGIYPSNSIYAMTFPPLLMRPDLVASYAEVRPPYFYVVLGRRRLTPWPFFTPTDFDANKPIGLDHSGSFDNVAKTLPRRVDNRIEAQKVTSSRTVSGKDDRVIFPTNRPATLAYKPSPLVTTTTPSSTSLTRSRFDSLALTPEDKRKCEQNFADCRQLSSYPTDIVEKLILENKIDKQLLVNEEKIKEDINTRFEGSGDDAYGNKKQFCSYKEDILYPQGGKNVNDEYRFIIQAPKYNITQGIRTETCVNEGDESCGGLKSYLPDNYQVICVQKYAYKQFVTISSTSPGTTTATREPIKIPSCCVCMYTDKK